jgi:hypothetical protein
MFVIASSAKSNNCIIFRVTKMNRHYPGQIYYYYYYFGRRALPGV